MIETAKAVVLVLGFVIAAGTGLFAVATEYRRNPKGWASPVAAGLIVFVGYLLLRGYPILGLLLLSAPIFYWTMEQARRTDPSHPQSVAYEGLGKVRHDKLGCWTTTLLSILLALALFLEALASQPWGY